jgi:dihydroorotate dehydrogenase
MLWRYLIRPLLFRFPAEGIHTASMSIFSACMFPPLSTLTRRLLAVDDPALATTLWGIRFSNPVGLAAGFDKHGRWFNALHCLGFSHIEIGTITGVGQPGNPKPRLFRLSADEALINRMGFNNPGADEVARNLARGNIRPVIGINIGKSKVTDLDQATGDYLHSLEKLWPYARYFTVNVSSPNTPGLRSLQAREPLVELLKAINGRNRDLGDHDGSGRKPVLLKIAPDLNEHELSDIAEVIVEAGVDGLIATNTTIERAGLSTPESKLASIGNGGLSGRPLTQRSRDVVRFLYRATGGKIPIVGAGGIMNGEDAWQMIRNGASMVQVYTGFIYGGPTFIRGINRILAGRLRSEGMSHISQAVGTAIH